MTGDIGVRARAIHANNRRIYHARGKGSRRLQLDQRDDLPARQPGWTTSGGGRRSRHGDLGLRPLPALLQADGDPPRRCRRLARAATARSSSNAGLPPIPCWGVLRRRRRGGYPRTPDINGYRQEGFAPSTGPSTAAVACPRPAPISTRSCMTAPTSTCAPRPRDSHPLLRDSRGRNRLCRTGTAAYGRSRGDRPGRRRDQHPQLLQLSRVSVTLPSCVPMGSSSSPVSPASATTSRTTSRSISSTRAGSPSRSRARPEMAQPAEARQRLAVLPIRARRDQPFRGWRVRPQQRRRGLPQPHVPLPADRHTI